MLNLVYRGTNLDIKKEVKKKVCPICGKSKSISTGFYKSASPLYQDDKCVAICISCVKEGIINQDDGTINKTKMKTMLQRLDKPLYWDDLDSSYNQYKKEHGICPMMKLQNTEKISLVYILKIRCLGRTVTNLLLTRN